MGAKISLDKISKKRQSYIVETSFQLREIGVTSHKVNRILKVTDDSTLISGKVHAHLSSIVFYYKQFIYGFVANYNIDGWSHKQKHLPNKYPEAVQHKVSFAEDEYIIEISVTWSKNSINSVSGRTNYGKKFSVECFDGYGTNSQVEKIYIKYGEVVCGLKSLIDEHLQGLYVVSAKTKEAQLKIFRENFTDQTIHATESDSDSDNDDEDDNDKAGKPSDRPSEDEDND